MRDILISFAELRRKFTILLLVMAALSCKEKAPVPRKKLVAVFTDVMILEGGNQAQYNFGNIPPAIWQRDYAMVLKKHNLDTADFRKSMEYLEKNPEMFSGILEEVITGLQKAEVEKKIPKP